MMDSSKKVCEISNPDDVFQEFYEGDEWLVIDVRGHELGECSALRIRSYLPQRGRLLGVPPDEFHWLSEKHPETLLRIGVQSAMELLRYVDIVSTERDNNTVWFILELRGIENSKVDVSSVKYILFPCSALESRIPGFGNGCGP